MSAQTPTAIFIDIEIDQSVADDAELAKKLEEVCPVDIFAASDEGTVEIVEPNLDECILCYQCVETAPDDTVRVVKLYEQP